MATSENHLTGAYRGAYREDLYDKDPEKETDLEEQDVEPKPDDMLSSDTPEPNDVDWEKRYGDLMSYKDRLKNEHAQQVETLEAELKVAQNSREQVFNHKSDEDINAFREDYGEVYDVIKTIAHDAEQDKVQALEQKVNSLEKDKVKTSKDRAYAELLALHPDFVNLQTDDNFIEWLEVQPSQIADGILKNSTDAKWAGKIVSLYKSENSVVPPKSNKKSLKDAAQAVGTMQRAELPEGGQPKMWKASEISSLSTRDFLLLEDEIDLARAENRVLTNE